MSEQRKVALWLLIVLGAFCVSAASVLVVAQLREEKAGLLATAELTQFKGRLEANPKDEALKSEIRLRDLQLRQDHFRNRNRFLWGSYLLLVGLIGWLVSARWFVALGEKPLPGVLEGIPRPDRPEWEAWGAGAAAVGVFLWMGFLALFGQPALLPVGMSSGPAKGAAPAATEPVSASAPATSSLGFQQNWPCFRGPDNVGVAAAGDWPTTWSVARNRNIVWASEIPAEGRSSAVVWADRVFVTGGTKDEHHVLCFDRATGKRLWDSVVKPPKREGKEETASEAGVAASTPVTDGRRVYAAFGTGILAAFDFDGKQAWTHDLGKPDNAYGFASSLMFYEKAVILQFDQGSDAEKNLSALMGLDPETGKVLWKTPRPVVNSWSTPALVRTAQRVELVACGDPWVIGYDPAGGKELWRAKGLQGDIAPSPAFGGGLIFVAQDGAQLMAIRPGGAGDVTKTNVVWTSDNGMPDIGSPVTDGKRLLQVAAAGSMTCFDAQKGALLWEGYFNGNSTASPIVAGGLVYIACDDGVTRILELGDKMLMRGQGEVGEPINATPAFCDSHIYIRGEKHLFCVGKKP